MIKVHSDSLIPRFLQNDRNGHAFAQGIEKGLNYFCSIIQNGLDTAINIDLMPEWRLDEMAWELNCLFDYEADIETKRKWIRNAVPLYASYGTVEAIYLYLSGYFSGVEVEENWQYGAEPYHFRVTVEGELTTRKEAWLQKAIFDTKNVRSVLDSIAIGSNAKILISSEANWDKIMHPMTMESRFAGTLPQEAVIGKEEQLALIISTEAKDFQYPYTIAGTKPQENTVSGLGSATATAQSEGSGTVFLYSETSGNTFCGEDRI